MPREKPGRLHISSIARRLIVACVGLYLAATCLITGIEVLSVSCQTRSAAKDKIRSLAIQITPQLSEALWNYNWPIIDLILHGLMQNDEVGRVELRNEKGRTVRILIQTRDRNSSLTTLETGSAQSPFLTAHELGPQQLFTLRYKPKGEHVFNLGTLIVRSSALAERANVLQIVAMSLVRTTATAALLIAILAFTVQRFLGRPLRDMARQLSSFDTSEPQGIRLEALSNRRNELTLVVRAFNAMAARVGENVSALRKSESQLRSFFEDSPISIWDEDFSDVKQRIDEARGQGVNDWEAYFGPLERVVEFVSLIKVRDVNRATLELLGCTDKAEILKILSENVQSDEIGAFRAEFIALASGKHAVEGESVHVDASGVPLFIHFRLTIVPGYEETWSRVIVSIVDLTERRKAERALEASEAKFRGLVEQSSEGIVLLNEDGIVADCNVVIERLIGVTKERILGRTIWDLQFTQTPDEEQTNSGREELRGSWQTAITACKNGTRAAVFETVLHSADRASRILEQTLFPIVIGSDLMLGAIVRDVTEVREASRAIMASLREKELLLQEIHHRVKNNLQIVCSLIHLELGKIDDSPPARRSLMDMEARVTAMSLVHELLYQSEYFAAIEFSSYVKQLCDHLTNVYSADRNRVKCLVTIEAVSLPLDKAIPCGLLINELVTNSLKHAFPGDRAGNIEVSMVRNGAQVSLEVKDDGVGTSGTVLSTVEPRSVGLTLVRSLANQLGSEIEISSKNGFSARIVFHV